MKIKYTRSAISKRKRFEVFKRDGFSCCYCGGIPPSVVLEIDHIVPVSKGGDNDINNLITACSVCNSGKSNIELGQIIPKLSENIEILKQKEEQYRQYKKFVMAIRKGIDRDINSVEYEFSKYFTNSQFTDKFRGSIKKFLKDLSVTTLCENMEIACLRIDEPENALKYFCGICWNQIKNKMERVL